MRMPKHKQTEKMFMKMYREDALRNQNFKCLYCLNSQTFKTITGEHKTCKSKGGNLSADNIGASCERCNKAKSNLNHDKFLKIINHCDIPKNVNHISTWFARRLNKRIDKMKNNLERICK